MSIIITDGPARATEQAAEKMEQATFNVRKGPISGRLEFMLPQNVYEYDYEITWQSSSTNGIRNPVGRTSVSCGLSGGRSGCVCGRYDPPS